MAPGQAMQHLLLGKLQFQGLPECANRRQSSGSE
jgi:hypothetical protein